MTLDPGYLFVSGGAYPADCTKLIGQEAAAAALEETDLVDAECVHATMPAIICT